MAVVVAADRAWCGGRVLWVSPVYRQSEEAFSTTKRLLSPVPVVTVRESTRETRFPSGGLIRFASGDSPDHLRGGDGWDLIVGDEWAYANAALWETLRPSLSERRGHGLFISSPRLSHDHWRALVDRGNLENVDRDPEWKSWTLPTSGAPHINPTEIENARRSMGTLAFQREYEAQFVGAEGARVHPEWIRTGDIPAGMRVTMGVDLAISTKSSADWTACVALARATDGTVYVIGADRIRGGFDAVLAFIVRCATRWSPATIAVEQVAYQVAAVQTLLRDTTLPVQGVAPKGDKLSRFVGLEARYEHGQVVHAKGLPPEFTDELLSFPVGPNDDFVDAMSLAFGQFDDYAERWCRAWRNVDVNDVVARLSGIDPRYGHGRYR